MNTNTPAATTVILATLPNTEYGIAAVVAKTPAGYSVALFDTDAEEYVGVCNIYPTEAQAMAAAEKVAA